MSSPQGDAICNLKPYPDVLRRLRMSLGLMGPSIYVRGLPVEVHARGKGNILTHTFTNNYSLFTNYNYQVYSPSINILHGLREYPNTRSTADATIVAPTGASARTTHNYNDRRLGRPTHHTTSRSTPGPDPPLVVLVVRSAVGSTGSPSRTRVDSYRHSHSSLGRRRILLPARYSSIRRRHPRGCRAQLAHSGSVRSRSKSSTPSSAHMYAQLSQRIRVFTFYLFALGAHMKSDSKYNN